jgi:hypothetical protein
MLPGPEVHDHEAFSVWADYQSFMIMERVAGVTGGVWRLPDQSGQTVQMAAIVFAERGTRIHRDSSAAIGPLARPRFPASRSRPS